MMKKIIIYVLFLLFVAVSVDAQPVSYRYGFAKGTVSKRPNLWRGLVGCWKPSLGITGTGTLFDVSGYVNHGTMNGSMTIDDWLVSGNPRNPGYALDFDGTNDNVVVDPDPIFDLNAQNFTYVGWGKLAAKTLDRNIVTKAVSGGSFTIELRYDVGDDYWEFNMNDGAWKYAKYSQANPSLNVWYHVVGVRDGTAIKIYVNGVLGSTVGTVGTLRTTTSGTPLNIGWNPTGGGSRYFSGPIDDVRIYNRALSAAEVWDMYRYPNAMFEFEDVFLTKPPAAAPGGINQAIIISRVFEKYFRGFTFLYEG